MIPRVSVILPVHNRADVLARAIGSVLAQRFKDFELIVVDDGSTDESVEVAKSFGDQRINLIELGQNRGGNAARNAGVRSANAPLFTRVRLPVGTRHFRIESRNPHENAVSEEFTIEVPAIQ